MSQARIAPTLLAAAALALAGCDALRVFFPAHDYETVAPELPADLRSPAILLFTKTNGYRHKESIPAGVALFEAIAKRRGWSIFHTENGAVFNPAQLARFQAAVWHNTSGDVLNDEQKAAFRAWLESGGGFVGVHGAGGDTSYDWPWYVQDLIRAQFIGHTMGPQFQDATLRAEVRDHPATRHLPGAWTHNEEWYSFEKSPRERDVTVLVNVDESTYSPRLKFAFKDTDLAMGDHPMVWHHCIGRGRVLYSALGHQPGAYRTPEYAGLLEGAVAWAARLEGAGCD